MRKCLLYAALILGNHEASATEASNCVLKTNFLWLPPISVAFEQTPQGGTLKLLGQGTHGDTVFELERQVLDVDIHNEKMVIRIGEKRIESDTYANDVSVVIEERKNRDGTLNLTLQTDTQLLDATASTTTLAGTLACQ
ncbi:hypothetical protein [Roseibium sp. MMSF_3544]|uniref:hypothetical protein n=1 Tax=unclassified Roseibium TaxID=2629323 RepID=UPI00273D364E|nr:hypothetical protein [Roseibium sp. MMSF_3544]